MGDSVRDRYAAIDIGTVTCRLLIADVDEWGIHELAWDYGITNLGEGLDERGYLSDAAMERVACQLRCFLEVIARYRGPDQARIDVYAVATSASRDAKNASDFLTLLKRIGVTPSIITGSREAALSFLGASHAYPESNVLVVDIGGGSTEISAGVHGQTPALSRSIDVGCRRITERFFKSDPPSDSEIEQARNWVAENLQGYFEDLAQSGCEIEKILAVAGTATSIVSVYNKMERYDRQAVHGSVVDIEEFKEVYEDLRRIDLAERKKVVGLEPDRAPVIVAGLLILGEILRLSERSSFTVSEADVLQGIILDASQNR